MQTKPKPSTSSRTSVRGLIVACLPAATIAFVANSPALGSALGHASDRDLTVNDKAGASTDLPPAHIPATNNTGSNTNGNWPPEYPMAGIRR